MRLLLLTASAALLAGCTAQPPMSLSARAQSELSDALAGRTAGVARDCLPSHSTHDMRTIGSRTILYGSGNTVYRNDLQGMCSGLGEPGYTLVTRSFGGGQLCRGDIAEVRDLTTGSTRGSCVIGSFTPYSKAAR